MEQLTGEIGTLLLSGGKLLVLLFMCLYLLFALVIVKQVHLMTKTLELGLEDTIKVFAYMHFLVAVGVLLISILVL